MRILALTSVMPFRRDGEPGVTAVNVVNAALIHALRDAGHDIALQVIFDRYRGAGSLSDAERHEREALTQAGISVFPELAEPVQTRTGRAAIWLALAQGVLSTDAAVTQHYPSVLLGQDVLQGARGWEADVALTLWSPEGVAALSAQQELPVVAYQGDVDFLPALTRVRQQSDQLGSGLTAGRQRARARARLWGARLGLIGWRRAHDCLMRKVDVIGCVTASNVPYYRALGHPAVSYVPNTWPDVPAGRPDPTGDEAVAPQAREGLLRIIGHVGGLSATGSTYGLRFLLRDVLPRLPRALAGIPYEVHIIGGGRLAPDLEPLRDQPGVAMRGFVPDLEAELRRCDMLLLLNNVGPYQAAFTRHVIAWSQQLCLVVHHNSQRAIPEIAHYENALVGTTGDDIARVVSEAATYHRLRQRVAEGGRRTYEQSFTPQRVAAKLSEALKSAVAARPRGRQSRAEQLHSGDQS